MIDLLLVIPSRNEQEFIRGTLLEADKALRNLMTNYKIVIVDASSGDGTVEIVEKIAEKDKRVDIIKDREPGAKGADIMYAFSKYDSRFYGFVDSDMVSTISSLRNLLRYKDNYDVIIGSRYMTSEIPERPMTRLYPSIIYNGLLSMMYRDGIRDHQCGFKLFSRKAVCLIRKYSLERHWAWDTEALLICKYGGLGIVEKKVSWKETRDRKSYANVKTAINYAYFFTFPMLRMFCRFKILGVVK